MGTTRDSAPARRDSHRAAEREVLDALRSYGDAGAASRQRIRDSLGLNATDVRALEVLLRARAAGETIGPRDLARALSISTASTSAVLDRLTAARHIVRRAHPTDGRAQLLDVAPGTAEALTEAERSVLDRVHDAAETFSDDDLRVAANVVDALADAVAAESADG